MTNDYKMPDYLFEVSWEVCNKVGGIYTVLSSKYLSVSEGFGDRYIFIGPDVWKETIDNPDFIEDKSLYKNWHDSAEKEGLRIRIGMRGRCMSMRFFRRILPKHTTSFWRPCLLGGGCLIRFILR